MPPQMILFAAVTLIPVPLIAASAVAGGVWTLAALLWLTALTASLDEFVARVIPATEDREFPAADGLSVVLALAHFGLLALMVAALAGDGLAPLEKAGTFTAAGLFFGQVSNANAHELIHRGGRGLRRLGIWVYISMGFGHHASAHPLVHHVRVATRADPSSARRGESFYRFARRAWTGSFREGYRAEAERLRRRGRPGRLHPYLVYIAGTLAVALAAGLTGGAGGVLAWAGLAAFAQTQLMMSDYVQHYGLSRAILPDGRPEPVGPRHSWNSPHAMSSALMLNAPRHSDHHAHPARRYPALTLPDPQEAPRLPHSLPVMCCLALWPRQWRRVMDPLADRWQAAPPRAGVTGATGAPLAG